LIELPLFGKGQRHHKKPTIG